MSIRPRTSSPLRALALAVALAGGAVQVAAQAGQSAQGQAIPAGSAVTFAQLAAAPFQTSHQSERVRRFLDDSGQLVQVREQLTLQATGSGTSPFKLDFVDLVGGVPDATARSRWSEVYRANAGLLHMHSGFRVTDPALAQQNYQIFDFGTARRSGRDVRRLIVFPFRADKAIWMLDVDTTTGVTLYSGEYDARLRLISEIETTSLIVTGSAIQIDPRRISPPAWSWRPKMSITRTTSLASAAPVYGSTPTQPAIAAVVPEYRQHLVQVTEDPVNGDKTLVLGYTDGIDEFFVLQSRGGGDPFAANPAIASATQAQSHAIASYDDPAMRAYVFHQSGATYWVVGSGSLVRLKDVAFRLCQQTVIGR